MAEITPEKAKELADAHWEFLVRWQEMIFKDGFIHGYKHGYEDAKQEVANVQ